MSILGIDLDKINLDDYDNFYDSETIIHFKLHLNFLIILAVYEELLQ